MSKEELIKLLKEYRENNAKLKLRQREKRNLEKELNNIQAEINMNTAYEINSDIRSKNQTSNKVLNSVIQKEDREEKIRQRIKELKKEIFILKNKVADVDIRLESLYYKEREILAAYYVDNRSAEEIGRNIYYKLYQRTCTQDNIYDIIKKSTKRMLNL